MHLQILELPEEVVIERAVDQLERMFGKDAKKKFVKGRVVSWGSTPYIWGAYTSPRKEEIPNARKLLAEPHANDSVFFAGKLDWCLLLLCNPLSKAMCFRRGNLWRSRAAGQPNHGSW